MNAPALCCPAARPWHHNSQSPPCLLPMHLTQCQIASSRLEAYQPPDPLILLTSINTWLGPECLSLSKLLTCRIFSFRCVQKPFPVKPQIVLDPPCTGNPDRFRYRSNADPNTSEWHVRLVSRFFRLFTRTPQQVEMRATSHSHSRSSHQSGKNIYLIIFDGFRNNIKIHQTYIQNRFNI